MGAFQKVVRPVILGAAQSSRMRRAAERIPVTRKVVDRFVAGETVPEAVDSVAQLRDSGRTVTIAPTGDGSHRSGSPYSTGARYSNALAGVRFSAPALNHHVAPSIGQYGCDHARSRPGRPAGRRRS